MLRARRHLAGHWLDHIVEAKLQMLMLAVSAECGWYRPGGIEDRHHVAYPSLAMFRQLLDATNRDLKGGGRLHRHPRSVPGQSRKESLWRFYSMKRQCLSNPNT